LVGNFLADLRQVVWRVGLLDVTEEFGPFAHQMHATSEHITGGAPLSRIDIGLGDHTTATQHGDLLRIDLIMFGFTPVKGFHVESMTQHKGNVFLSTELGQPVPRKETFNGYHKIVTIRGDGFEKGLWGSLHILVHEDFPIGVDKADLQATSMQVDTAVEWVLMRVKAHVVASSWLPCFPITSLLWW
jgi:hypothetical protein